MKYTVTSSIKL